MSLSHWKKYATGLLLSLIWTSFGANATPITDTVLIDGKEWAQPSQFEDLGYAYIKEYVCPETVCTGVVRYPDGRNIDLSGWVWASIDEVRDLFHTMLPTLEGRDVYRVPAMVFDWAETVFEVFGFKPTVDDELFRSISGVTSTVVVPGVDFFNDQVAHAYIDTAKFIEIYLPDVDEYIQFIDVVDTTGTDQLVESGGWFYRPAPATGVPVPGSGLLLLVGLAGLATLRRNPR